MPIINSIVRCRSPVFITFVYALWQPIDCNMRMVCYNKGKTLLSSMICDTYPTAHSTVKECILLLSIFDPFRELNILSIFVRLLFVTLCAGVIGMEREQKGRAAGLRTHVVVGLGAAMVMMTNQYLIAYINPNADPARLGAQVISGIGFLGAGTILVTGHQKIKGLTTAAGLWASACMGLAIGGGFFEIGIIAAIFILFTMTVLQSWELRLSNATALLDIEVELQEIDQVPGLLNFARQQGVEIKNIDIIKDPDRLSTPGHVVVQITMRKNKTTNADALISRLSARKEVVLLREL